MSDWCQRLVSCSRWRLSASKTQVIWLGSNQQLDKIDVRVVPIMTTCVPVSGTVRELDVILGSRLTSDHGRSSGRCLSIRLLSATPDTLCRAVMHCQLKVPMQWSTLLFHVYWTTVTHCWLRSVTVSSDEYRLFSALWGCGAFVTVWFLCTVGLYKCSYLLTYLLTYGDNNLCLRALALQPLEHVPSSTSNNNFFSSLLSSTVFMTADCTWFPVPFITLKA